MPTYRVLVCDTRTGLVLDELPFSNFDLNVSVDWARGDSFGVDVPLLGARHQTRNRVVGLVREPWKRTFCLLRGNRALWAGPVISSDWSQTGLSFTCAGLPKLLERRLAVSNPQDTRTVVADARDAMAHLLNWSVERWTVNGDQRFRLPLAPVTIAGGTGAISRTYYGRDLPKVYESVKKVTEEEDAPDVRIGVTIDGDQKQITWLPLFGDPYLGSVAPSVAWDYPGNIKSLTGSTDGSSLLTRGWVVGDGQNEDRLIMSAENTLADDGFPWMDEVDRTAISTRDTFVVQALANSYAAANSVLAESWDLTVNHEFPGLERWELGDNHLFRVSGHGIVPNGEYLRRVTGYTLTPESLSLETLPAIEGVW